MTGAEELTGSGLLGPAHSISDGQRHRGSPGAQADLEIGPQLVAAGPAPRLPFVEGVQLALGHAVCSLNHTARVIGLDGVCGA